MGERVERCSGPVQTSAVYLLGTSAFPAVPPPSPPSPVTPGNEEDLCSPIEDLSLDAVDSVTITSPVAVAASASAAPPALAAGPSSSPNNTTAAGVHDDTALSSPPATAPASATDSPELSPCVLSPNVSSTCLSVTTAATSPVASSSASASVSGKAPASSATARLAGAVHVLSTEATALQSVAQLYATSPAAQDGFHQAVEAIVRTQTSQPPGKLVVVGVGKSGHIGKKLVATFNSLAVPASFLHPTEALHGDLGHIRPHDALLFITYSGKTQELVTLLPHIDPALPLIILTSHVTAETCELVRHRNTLQSGARASGGIPGSGSPAAAAILLPAPIPVEEKVSFGVAAPTASTTTALAVGDALAIVTSTELHPSTESVFRRNHPGGAIGAAFQHPDAAANSHLQQQQQKQQQNDTIRNLAVPWRDIPIVHSQPDCADVLRAGYSSANGWVRVVTTAGTNSDDSNLESIAPPSRIRALRSADLARPVHEVPGLVIGRPDFVAVAADTKVRKAAEWLRAVADASASEEGVAAADAVVAVIDNGEVAGVLELQDLLKAYGDVRA
ncbi:sugar isomerase [Sporothrix brasiliensis 5110]|uniref:Sugar isomerase n=1 Tax=Sporothrix brasiliensis 5110 TaxID=1398154 RepID=A0A0C2JC47_9PEZI|nr:sugar isomerase [Sporothrix brasiliensis 5110]KIH94487.1 sugar isomerase [Sporothrix brasiliensis 5110]